MLNLNYMYLESCNKIVVEINENSIDITNTLENYGYIYYDSIQCKNPRFYKHIYKNLDKYYLLSKVYSKHLFVIDVELIDITNELIKIKNGGNFYE